MRRAIQTVLFDLDGVIVFTDRYHYLAWKQLADEQGWKFDEQVNHAMRGIPRMASLQVILDHNGIAASDDEKAAWAERKNEYYKQLLAGINQEDVYPGVVDFLRALKGRDVRLGLCSSSKNARTVLDALGLTPYFDAVVTGDDFQRAKPDPEVFLLGAAKLRTPPFHCLVFEDAPAGVQAALAAKMKCVGVGPAAGLPEAAECIERYEEIDIDALLDSGRVSRLPVEPWALTETTVRPKRAQYWETLFALTNGYLGLRGSYEEDDAELREHAYPGMFINGIYDYEPYNHIVSFPGYPQERHVMLNLCDWRILHVDLDGERFSLFRGTVSEYRRSLDLKRGVVVRSLVWESPRGKRTRIETTRLVSMRRRHSAAIRYTVTPLNWSGPVTFESVTRGTAPSGELAGTHYEVVQQSVCDDARCFVGKTVKAPFRVGMALHHKVSVAGVETSASRRTDWRKDCFVDRFTLEAVEQETPVTLDKFACFYTNIEADDKAVLPSALEGAATDRRDGFDVLLEEQARFWKAHWEQADLEIDGADADQQAVRFALFHLRQSHPEDDRRSISACGMTGDHYWGHVFWDTEMYIAPSFLYVEPALVRPLLMYRYHLLDRARERARQMGGIGALYSWNSISGEECGIIYEASTAEYHLLSAIAHAVAGYVRASGDTAFLRDYGAEILFETSRFLEHRGAYIPARDNRFCINVVCGPDEYGCGINNNCYTNVMAQWHLRYAADVYARLAAEAPEALAALAARIGLADDEPVRWRAAADAMYIPYHEGMGIHAQDDAFLYLDPVDMDLLPRNTDLRELYHPLNLWRMQVAKQADVVLLMLTRGELFSQEQKRANYEYYEPRTNHGSSLSPSIHSIIAAEIGKTDEAYGDFRQSALMDINDFKNNTAGGVHAACLGGTWMAVVNGFAGFRDYESEVRFDPVLPPAWTGLRFKLRAQGRLLGVDVARDRARYTLLDGPEIDFMSGETRVSLTKAAPSFDAPVRH